MTAALAGAAAPYVAEIIGHRSGLDDTMEKAAAHAVANAVLAAMQGKDALAGAAGARSGSWRVVLRWRCTEGCCCAE
jgi:filamentous hemagglutinin